VPHISLLRCGIIFVRSTNPAPKARIIPAQGIALGLDPRKNPRAESPTYQPFRRVPPPTVLVRARQIRGAPSIPRSLRNGWEPQSHAPEILAKPLPIISEQKRIIVSAAHKTPSGHRRTPGHRQPGACHAATQGLPTGNVNLARRQHNPCHAAIHSLPPSTDTLSKMPKSAAAPLC
jgi:hypothetical protein